MTLERRLAVNGDTAVPAELLVKVPTRDYDVGDAWVLGRIPTAADSIRARFLAAALRGAMARAAAQQQRVGPSP